MMFLVLCLHCGNLKHNNRQTNTVDEVYDQFQAANMSERLAVWIFRIGQKAETETGQMEQKRK